MSCRKRRRDRRDRVQRRIARLRRRIARSGDRRRAPQHRRLPRAPLAGLIENGPNGPLPIIASNGRTPAQAYARPFTASRRSPDSLQSSSAGSASTPPPRRKRSTNCRPEITLSFVPYAQNLQAWIDRARARGHEVMLELPMEPFDPDADDTGPQTLLASAPRRNKTSRGSSNCSRAAPAISASPIIKARALRLQHKPRRRSCKRCAAAALAFISSGIGQRTALSVEAQRAGTYQTPPPTASSMRAVKPTPSTINC